MSILGGMSRLTALAINNDGNDIRSDAGQNKNSGLWAGCLILYRDNDFDRILINTQDIFPNKEAAIAEVDSIVQQLRAMSVAEILAPTPEETPANPPNPA